MEALRRMYAQTDLRVATFCCGCSLRAGVLLVAALDFINAVLSFSGEAALYSPLLVTISAQTSGYLPPGVAVDDPRIKAGLVAVGLYMLLASVIGFLAATRRQLIVRAPRAA